MGESPLTTIQGSYGRIWQPIESKIQLLGVYGDVSDHRVVFYPEGSYHFIDIVYLYELTHIPDFILSTESLAISQFNFPNIPFDRLICAALRPINDFLLSSRQF